jgi:prephenate dehydrogenase
MTVKTVAIIGLGLIGGSLALALKANTKITVLGYDESEGTVAAAQAAGAIDRRLGGPGEVGDADVVVFSLPVGRIAAAVEAAADGLKAGAIVTDVGSAKRDLQLALPKLLPSTVSYVGGHPMAGAEKSGFAAARGDLFAGRPYILTGDGGDMADEAVKVLVGLVRSIGAQPLVMDSELHDMVVARISHVPHVAAAVLARMAGDSDQGDLALTLAANGFRDMTRIASSNPALWSDICLGNRENVVAALLRLRAEVDAFLALLTEGDRVGLEGFFAEAKRVRDRLAEKAG